MAEFPNYLKLILTKGKNPDPHKKRSPWSQASAEQKNSWVKTTIDHLLKNHNYSTVYSLTFDIHKVFVFNGLFTARPEEYTDWISSNPGITAVATQLFKEKQSESGSVSNKTENKNDPDPEKKSDDLLIIGIVVTAIILIAAVWLFLKK